MQALPYVVVKREGVTKVYEVRALAARCLPGPWPSPPYMRSLNLRTFFSYIGRLSKSEEERLVTI